MIVDAHVHLVDGPWLPAEWWRRLEAYRRKRRTETIGPTGPEENNLSEPYFDPDGEKLLRSMDRAGIEKSVILPLDFGLLLGEPEVPIAEQNRKIAMVASQHADRMLPFAGVDPRRPEALDLVRRCVEDFAMKGVKLHPGSGFDPENPGLTGFMSGIAEMKVPVIFHTGPAFGPLSSRGCRPLALDRLLSTYPDMPVIAAHMGGGWFDELCWMAYAKPNLYTDLSLWQIRCRSDRRDFTRSVRKALDMFGPRRVLFATDGPFGDSALSADKYVRAVQSLKEDEDHNFLSAEIKGMLGKNAAAVMGLS